MSFHEACVCERCKTYGLVSTAVDDALGLRGREVSGGLLLFGLQDTGLAGGGDGLEVDLGPRGLACKALSSGGHVSDGNHRQTCSPLSTYSIFLASARAAFASVAGSSPALAFGCFAAAACAAAARDPWGGRYPSALCSSDMSLRASAVEKP